MLRSLMLIAFASFLINATATAGNEDNATWIAKCVDNNKKEGQPVETVMVYCHCMNSQMSENESQSISEWEQNHPQEAKACAKKSGWQD